MLEWQAFLVPAAVLLVIPVATIPAFSRPNGSIIISAALAAGAFAIFWLALGGMNGLGSDAPAAALVLYGGVLITLVTWALTLNGAAQARKWVWVALLVVAGYVTAAAIYASFSLQICFGPDFACPPPDPLKQALAFAGYLACPIAALVYGVRPSFRRVRQSPEGLVVSSLRAAPSSGGRDEERAEG